MIDTIDSVPLGAIGQTTTLDGDWLDRHGADQVDGM